MKRFCVTVKAYEEFWVHEFYNTLEEAEDWRDILEKQMPDARIEVRKSDEKEVINNDSKHRV